MDRASNSSVAQTVQNIKVIWLAMLVATLAMLLVVEGWRFWEPGFTGFVPDLLDSGLIRYVFIAVALAVAVVVFVLRKRLPPPVSASAGLALDAEAVKQRAQKRFTLNLVCFSLIQDIAILGLVLFLIGGARMDFYLFAVPSFVMLLALKPGGGAREI